MSEHTTPGPDPEHRRKMWVIFHDRAYAALKQIEEVGHWDVTDREAQVLEWWLHFHSYCHAVAADEDWTIYASCPKADEEGVIAVMAPHRLDWGWI